MDEATHLFAESGAVAVMRKPYHMATIIRTYLHSCLGEFAVGFRVGACGELQSRRHIVTSLLGVHLAVFCAGPSATLLGRQVPSRSSPVAHKNNTIRTKPRITIPTRREVPSSLLYKYYD
jgi:hypothetical protein